MFKLEIKTGGAAFRGENQTDSDGDYVLDPFATEVCGILQDVRVLLANCETDGVIIDSNGNKVGCWRYE